MVNTEHVAANLRLTDENRNFIRTFSGVRPAVTANQVGNVLMAVNSLSTALAKNALHTARLEIKEA